MPDTVPLLPFAVLGAAVLVGALMVVASRDVVHAAFWLLEVMIAVGGLCLLLSAEFVALVQVMVHGAAVSALVLFTIMLTLRGREDAVRPRDFSAAAAGLAGAAWISVSAALGNFRPVPLEPALTPGVAELSRLLFTRWALPLEIASVVLLVALVAAVKWAGGEEDR
jgi:NADH-quinone oxidoreductase subunit J